ncbi:putative galanin receptor type 1-like [Apostichopus japonicus]|uniref:Putative galanin receptor type 1-like n=1 Tax=Stichopus japonicus TaxID=307972 RepID=A0A2G8KXZ3_STIJA|nr:putative galanin receptor type 1-like [Apostichopus japonicus]
MGTTDPVPEPEPAGGLGTCFKSVVIAVAILTTVIGTVGNVLVILVVARTGRSRTVTDIFLASLAYADLLVCVICTPLLIIGVLRLGGHTGINYEAEQVIFYFSSVASILNLTAIAVDRFDAVTNATHRRLDICISYKFLVIIWAASALIGAIIYLIPERFEFAVLALAFVIPFTAMIEMYRRILKTAGKSDKLAANAGKKKSGSARMDRTVRMVMIVLGVFVVSWVPSLVSRLFKYILTDVPAVSIARMEVSACLIAYVGSGLNFLVYAFMSRKFKVELYRSFETDTYMVLRMGAKHVC